MKKIYTITNINHNGKWYDADTPLNADDFTKEELRSLYDNGAIEVRTVESIEEMKAEPPAPWEEDVKEELEKAVSSTPEKTAGPDTTVTSPAKAAPMKAAPAKATDSK